jgi:polygalacturonase
VSEVLRRPGFFPQSIRLFKALHKRCLSFETAPKQSKHNNALIKTARFSIDSLESRQLLSAPPLPTIGTGTWNVVTNFGAVGDGATDCTTAIQNALNASNNSPSGATHGGTVTLPAGPGGTTAVYLCGPLNFFSNTKLLIQPGAILRMEPYGSSYFPVGVPSGSTPDPRAYPQFIDAESQHDIEISGGAPIDSNTIGSGASAGIIDGQGAAWWSAFDNKQIANRPIMIYLHKCTTIEIDGIKLMNPPAAHISFKDGDNNATVQNMTIATTVPSHNTDGMDISGQHILITNCDISDGDDNIALGGSVAFSSDVTVTNSIMRAGHGLTIGSITKGGGQGINGFTVSNIQFFGTDAGIRIKSDRGNGGTVQNLSYTNLTMTGVSVPINISAYYPDNTRPSPPANDAAQSVASTPVFKNITISNLTATSSGSIGIVWGLPEAPVQNITFNNVNISTSSTSSTAGLQVYHVQNMQWTGSSSITVGSSTLIPLKTYDQSITLPNGWINQDVGAPMAATAPAAGSSFAPTSTAWTMQGVGTDILATSDQFNFSSLATTGNALVTTKISSLTNAGTAGKAGVMIRDGTAANSIFAAVVELPTKQVEFIYRNAVGATSIVTAAVGDTTNAKFVKLGNTFTPWYSTDGTTWTAAASPVTIAMSTSTRAGIFVTSASATAASTASFSGWNVVNDNTAPSITAQNYLYSTALNKLSFTFSEDVSATLSTSSLNVVTSPGGTPITVTALTYTPGTNVATFTLATPLADSNYTATLTGSTTTDPVGNSLAGGNATLSFFVLPGDVNRDGTVNLLDLNAIATNFGASGASATFANGNVDFNGTVDVGDFNTLAAQFGSQIANPASAQPRAAQIANPAPSQPLVAPSKPLESPSAPSSPLDLFSSTPIQSSVNLADQTPDPLALAGNAAQTL